MRKIIILFIAGLAYANTDSTIFDNYLTPLSEINVLANNNKPDTIYQTITDTIYLSTKDTTIIKEQLYMNDEPIKYSRGFIIHFKPTDPYNVCSHKKDYKDLKDTKISFFKLGFGLQFKNIGISNYLTILNMEGLSPDIIRSTQNFKYVEYGIYGAIGNKLIKPLLGLSYQNSLEKISVLSIDSLTPEKKVIKHFNLKSGLRFSLTFITVDMLYNWKTEDITALVGLTIPKEAFKKFFVTYKKRGSS